MAKRHTPESIKKEYDSILEQLGDPGLISDWEKFEELQRRKSQLEKIAAIADEIAEADRQIIENQSIVSTGEDQELTSLAETEAGQLKERKETLTKQFDALVAEISRPSGPKAAVVEIRAGTGGEEAALFAADIYRMYSRFAQVMGWHEKVLDANRTEIGGIKQIVFELKGNEVWLRMKYEAGVHRIQRIPLTEKSGRIHTSTATVAVLPKHERGEHKIRPDELKVDFFCSSGPGGQYVNKRQSAVRVTHLPTGLVVASQTERNQLSNRENAMALLEFRLQELREKQEESEMGGARNVQIGGAKRSEKIRTYNFPQDRLTDHRIKKSWHNLEEILNGNLKDIGDSLIEELETKNPQ